MPGDNVVDISGQRFGRWTVRDFAKYPSVVANRAVWNCVCDCGTERVVTGQSLRYGTSKSCGCIQRESKTWTVEKQRAARRKHRNSIPNYRWRENLRYRFGITPEDVDYMLADQNGLCLICQAPLVFGSKGSASIDHDHTTGEVRGILCFRCNTGLGHFQDNPKLLSAAITYLGSPPAKRPRLRIVA